MKVEFNAGSQRHFCNWLIDIYKALPDELRGGFYAKDAAAKRAREFGVTPLRFRRFDKNELVCVASYQEYRTANPAQVIFVNHGAGQRYEGDGKGKANPSYSGGEDRDRTVLFICPSEKDAEVNRQTYPLAETVACGVPYMDRFHGRDLPKDGPIAISWHADIRLCSETRNAFPHYKHAIIDLIRSQEFDIIGHCHPKAERQFKTFWRHFRIPYEPNWWKVMEQASLFVCDNSSTIFEFAALDKPVVVLDAPWYRDSVEHGLRFWSEADVGIRIQEPDQLTPAIRLALTDPIDVKTMRRRIVRRVYGELVDGKATERAIQAIASIASRSTAALIHS